MYSTFIENYGVRQIVDPGTYDATANYSTFLDIRNFEEITFLPQVKELGDDIVCILMENSSASSSGATNLTDRDGNTITGTFTNGTDEERAGVLIARNNYTSSGSNYVGMKFTPANANDNFSCLAILGGHNTPPPLNGTAEEIAFIDGK